MKGIMQWIVPKEKKFFDMLIEQSENAIEAAKELKIFVNNYHKFERKERKEKVSAIKNIELKGDEISKKIFQSLNENFRTSVDKDCMRKMAVLLDDITNLINATALKLVIFGVERIDNFIIKLVEIINRIVSEVSKSISISRKLKKFGINYAEIQSLEREADDIYHEALYELFQFHKHSIDIIRYKEIYELLEAIVDKCLHAANIIEDIAAKRR